MEAAGIVSDDDFFSANPPGITDILKTKTVFIAGAGGLGSNLAAMLARAGVINFHIADFDIVSAPNINRQNYYRDQIGMMKVSALKENLLRINPNINLTAITEKLSYENYSRSIPKNADIIFECFDNAAEKAGLSEFWALNRKNIPLIAVSGLAGIGQSGNIRAKRGKIRGMWIIGDGKTEMNSENGTISSRVMLAASLQAHLGIRMLSGLEVQCSAFRVQNK
jgi:sulfur carrier protein ThiS adenylyltransferase